MLTEGEGERAGDNSAHCLIDSRSTSNPKESQCKGVLSETQNGDMRERAFRGQRFLGQTGKTQGSEFGEVMLCFLWPFL